MRNNKNYKENSNYNSKKEKQQSKIKKILLIFVFILLIIALQFGISKYISTTDQTHLLYFYEYRIQLSEIVLSTENYTGGEVTVEITTQKPGLSIQYQLGDSGEWIDYVGPFSVDENVKINTRLVSEPDNFTGPITSKEIKNIAVAKIGDQYFKTLAAAIDACAENAGDNKTKIEMLANIEENVVIPEGKNIVLDLCGATIKNKSTNENGTQNTNPTIAVNGKLNLIDSAKNENGSLQGEGKVTSTTAEAIKVLGNGNFVLGTNESGTGAENVISIINPVVEGNTYGVALEGNAKFEFYDGIISGKTNAINGIVAATPEYYEVVSNKENDYEVAILSQAATITFDKNADESVNITLEYETATKVIGQPIESLPTAQREGYVFVGWFTAKENGEQITAETIVEGTATYYAIWEAYTYTIEYNANGGSGTTQETNAKYDEEIIIPDSTFTAPEGYTFKEWNTNAEGTGTIYNPGDKVINLSNEQSAIIQLYAIWEDTIAPSKTAPTGTGTTNTITVNCNQTDAGSGIDETTVQYAIFNKDTNADGKPDAWSEWQNSNIFENLSTNTEYEVKTQVTDKNGNGPVESEIGKISTSKIENGSIEVRKENAQGEIIKPETSAENKENQVNSNIYIDITPSTTGTTTVTVKTPDGQTTTYKEDTTITTQTGMYEIIVETTDGTNTVTDTYYVFVDKTVPTAQPTTLKTTNTITVNANAQDAESGIADVTYTIKKGGEIVETNKTGEFAGLEDNIEYTVEITITDKAGNTTTKIENVKTEELVAGSIVFTETTSGEKITPAGTSAQEKVWANENINTVLTQGSAGTTTYEVTAPDGTKTTYTTDTQITTQEGTYTVTVTTTDGKNTETVTYYFNVDKTLPTVSINPNEQEYTIAVSNNMATIGTTLTATDNENGSGIAVTKYAWSTSNTQEPESWSDFINAAQVTKSVEGGVYYVWTNVEDKAGNKAVSVKTSGEFNVGYVVEFDANGGVGEIASQRKEHGTDLTITNEKPTRDMYIFKGWATSADSTTVEYTVNALYTTDDSVRLYAVWSEVVASTTIDGVTTNYDSVQNAIIAAGTNEGAVVTLLKDEIAEKVTVAKGQNIILDVNGKTLTYEASTGYTINNMGELTIIGEGTIKGNTSNATIKSNTTGKTVIAGNCLINAENHYAISNNNVFIVNNGTIASEVKDAIYNYATGTVEINGGLVQGVTYGVYNNGNITVSGGTVQGNNNAGIVNINQGTITITGGSIKGKHAINNSGDCTVKITGGEIISEISLANRGNLEITGGKIYGKTYGIDMNSDMAVVTIGTNEENPSVDITTPVIIGESCGINNPNNYTFNFYDGIIMGPTSQTIKGTVTDTPTGYRVVNGTQTVDGVEYETAYLDNTYYITFDDNCTNGTTTTLDKKYNNKLETLPTPTTQVTGYAFDGWYTDKTAGTKITAETVVSADVTYYAHWVANTDTDYTVYHYRENANDGNYELVETQYLEGTSDASLTLANLTKAGENELANCSVLKTTLTENGESVLTTTIAPDGSTKVYIYYTRNKFALVVTPGKNVNTATGSGTYKWGQTVNLTAEVESLAGYTYSNFTWAITNENVKIEDIVADKTNINTTLTMPAEEIIVSAISDRTAITYNLTYNLDGGEYVDGKTNVATYTVEDEITLNPVEKQGYVFLGWKLSTLNGETVDNSTVVNTIPVGTTGNREYTAVYNNGEVSYTVYHYLENANNSEYTLYNTQSINAKTNDVITLNSSVAIEVPNATYEKSTESIGGNQGTSITVKADSSSKIYVYYKRNTYTLNILAGNNTKEIKINNKAETAGTFKYGATVEITASLANLNGYTYSNFRWETINTSILASTTAQTTTVTMPAENTTITAVADRTINTYTITYTLDGGAVAGENPITYTVESSNITLINPTKTGYTFTGWTGTDLSSATKNVIISTGSYGNRSYTANWEINKYKVTYDYAINGGKSSTVTSAEFNYNTAIDLTPVATKDNYGFIGWNTDKNATIAIDTLTMGTQNVTLYAIYEKDVTVEFDKNGGAIDVTDTYKMYNTNTSLEITMPEPTTFAGWTFNGYASTNNATSGDAQGTTKTITIAENVTNVTYYHTWKKQVTFNANKPETAEDSYNVTINETSREIYYNNAFGTLPTNPTLSGWTFAGWYTANNGGTQITKDTLAQDVPANIYAGWTLSTSISVSPENVTLDLSDNTIQNITVTGSNYGSLTYEADDNTVATVDENGVITALKNGTTTITVTGSNGQVKDTITVTVVTTPTSVEISQDSATIGVVQNNTVQLNATIQPETANEDNKITWTSSNPDIATVDQNTGVVTGKSDGKVTITATTENGCTDTCEITVDATAPTVAVSMDNANYAKEHTATITISDSVSGLPASQEISYAWSTSKEAAPQNWETANINATIPATASSITVKTPSDLTGVYYLWVKSGIKDNFANTTTQNYINAQATANLDNIAPTVTINPNTKEYTIAVGENMATIGTTITATDNENGSGIAITKYAWSTSNTEEPQSWLDFTNAVEVTKTVEGGKYYVWTNVEDTAGNKAVSVKTSGEFNVGYAVEYNANGGVGEIASQRKEYGVNLTLTNEKPTREMYIFKGWATSADSATVEYAANVLYTTDAPIRLYAVWSEVVASTTIDGVTTNYDSVQGAIDAAGTNPGATVTLLKDEIAETVTIAKNQDINIDVNGKTWANIGDQTITNNGKLTLKGDGKVTSSSSYTITNNGTINKYGNGTIEYTGRAYAIRNAGTANLYEGNITSNNTGVDNKDGGKVVVSGIKIDTIGIAFNNRANTTTETISNPGILITSGLIESDNIAINNNENRAIDIQGGTIKSNAERAIYNLGNTKIQIANATVEGTSGIESSQGEIIVNEGANIIGTTNYGIDIKVNAKVTVNRGTVEGYDSGIKNANAQVLVNEGSNIIGTTNKGIVNYPDGIVEITGGTVTGKIYGIRNEVPDSTGTIIVTGGKITSESIGIESYGGTLILGTNDGTISTETPYIFSKDEGISLRTGITTFEFYDGIAIGLEGKSITGTVTKIPDGYCIEKGTETIDGTTYETSILKQQYTITYNSNGEETPPATQYKIHDENITLSSEILYRDYYVFKGWATAQNATTPEYLPGATYTANASATLYAVWVDAIASTKVGEKVTFYDTVQGAIDAAGTNAGATVTLLKDEIAESITVAADQDILLNLNGKKLANSGAQTITNNGTLTLNGEGTVTSSNQYTIKNYGTFEKYGNSTIEYTGTVYYALRNAGTANLYEGTIISNIIGVENKEGGKVLVDGITIQSNKEALRNYIANTVSETLSNPSVIIKSGLIESNSTNAIYCSKNRVTDIQGGIIRGTIGIQVVYNAILNVSNATIEGSDTGISNYNNGQIFINEGNTIIGNNLYGITNDRDGIVTVTGGTIKGKAYGIVGQGTEELVGTIIITGGTINGKTAGVSQAKEDTLIIGTDDGVVDIEKPVIISGTQGVSNIKEGTFEFYDGIINGPDGYSITGTVTDTPTGYRVVNGTQTIDGTTYETAYLDNTYHITFNENYENAPTTTKDIKYNTAIGELPTPTRENYIFDGWYTAQTDGEKITKETVITADTTFYAHWLEVVASTTIGDVTTNYASVQNAIDAAGTNAGATVTLLKDEIAETVTIAKNQDINIDINGKTWVNIGDQTITNSGKLTLKGDGKVTSSSRYTIYNNGTFEKYGNSTIEYTGTINNALRNSGTLNLYEGNIVSEKIGIENKDDGKVLLSGINIYAKQRAINNQPSTSVETISNPGVLITSGLIESDNITINGLDNRAIVIQGGTIKSNNDKAIYYEGNSKIQIDNAKVEGTMGIDCNGAGEIIINEGSYIIGRTTYGINNKASSTVTINGGTVEGYDTGIRNMTAYVFANEGSNIIGTTNEGIFNSIDGIVEITGGTVSGKNCGIRNDGSTGNNTAKVIMTGGKITSESIGVRSFDGTLIIGTDDETISTETPYVFAKNEGISVSTNVNFEFYDGIAIGLEGKSISGTVIKIPDGYSVVKGTETIDGVEYETSYLKQQYTITYNSNGEETAPVTQYKIHDQDLTLTSDILTRDYYVFKGWATTEDATTPEYLPGATYTANSSATLYAVWVDAVASTTVGEHTTFYDTVQGAIDSAGNNKGAAVTLLKDEIAETVTVAAGQDIVIDLNGKTWADKGTQTITNNGTLTINGEGAIAGSRTYTIVNNGIFTKYGEGVIKYNNTGNYALRNSGVANLYEGKIISGRIGVDNKDGAELLIDGITIEAEESAVSISGKALVQIVDGLIKSQKYAIHIANAEGTVIIGTNEESPEVSTTSPVIIGASSGVHNWKEGIVKIYDGIIMGETERSIMGSIAEIPDGYCIVNGTETIDGITYETAYLDNIRYVTFNENYDNAPTTIKGVKYGTAIGELTRPKRENYVFKGWFTAQTDGEKITKDTIITEDITYYAHWEEAVASTTIGGTTTYHLTIGDAISAAGTYAGATVTLLKDEISESVTVASDKDIVIDLNEKTWINSGTVPAITNNGTLKMQGNGKVIATGSATSYAIVNNGTFEKYGNGIIEYDNTANYALRNAGVAKLYEGKIISGRIGIENKESAKLLIDGITIEASSISVRNVSTLNSLEEPAVKILSGEIISNHTRNFTA